MRPAREARDRPGDRGGHDDAALPGLLELRDAGLHAQEGALEIGRHDMVPLGGVHLDHLGLREDAGVGAQDVDAAEGLGGLRDHRLHGGPVGDVAEMHLGGPAGAPDFLDRLRGGVLAAGDDHDLRAGAREHPRDALADALRGAGDDGAAARDRCQHGLSPRFWFRRPGARATRAAARERSGPRRAASPRPRWTGCRPSAPAANSPRPSWRRAIRAASSRRRW
jgi:hypothetical protein